MKKILDELYVVLQNIVPVGNIAEKAVCRSVFFLNAQLTKTNSFRLFFLPILPTRVLLPHTSLGRRIWWQSRSLTDLVADQTIMIIDFHLFISTYWLYLLVNTGMET